MSGADAASGDKVPVFEPWIHGTDPAGAPTGPPIRVQRISESSYVLRQSKRVDYEAPFMFLLLGTQRAFLLDSGATADDTVFPLRAEVDAVINLWLEDHPNDNYELVVGHSHQHHDHIAGDGQFVGRPHTTVIGADLAAVRSFYGFAGSLAEVAILELGGRSLEVIRIPGHDETSIALFDPQTGWLLTGDTVYPGRLYVQDPEAFVASINRLSTFAKERPVSAVMGCHIEMTQTPGVDYPQGTNWQPDEPSLVMTVAQLHTLNTVAGIALEPGRHVFDDVIIVSSGIAQPG
ncbi:MAG: fold metallo-hydrolase [Glaciihabitans sp.]|nr:fold metallo-hydrolase [Glaciihabitans sp.]